MDKLEIRVDPNDRFTHEFWPISRKNELTNGEMDRRNGKEGTGRYIGDR